MKNHNQYPNAPISGSVESNNTLYTSGQIGLKEGKLVNSSFEDEVEQAIINLADQIKSADFDIKNCLKVTIYTTKLSDYETINKVYSKFFVDKYPAREVVEVCTLPLGASLEISAIVAK